MGYLMLILDPCFLDHRILHPPREDTYIILLKFLVFLETFQALHTSQSLHVKPLEIHFHFVYLSFVFRFILMFMLLLSSDTSLSIIVSHCKELPSPIDHSFHHSQILLLQQRLNSVLLLFELTTPILFSFSQFMQ